jgi:uncharacterized membrane protein
MKKDYSRLFVIITCLALSFIHCPLFEIFFDDKEIFKYTGLVLHKGGVPYRDFFDHKPPLIFFLNYLGLALGSWGLWIIDTLLILSATLLFFNTCKTHKVSLAWLPPVLFNLMIRNNSVSMGIGMTREYSTIFLLVSFCLVMSEHKYKFYLLGLATGMVFFFQQDQVLPLLPFLLYATFNNSIPLLPSLLKRGTALLTGFLTVAIPIVLYFLLNHSMQYFWEDAFLFNFNWYNEKKPLWLHLTAIRKFMHNCDYDVIFYGAVIVGIASLVWGNKKKWLLISSIAAVLLSFCSEFLSAKLVTGVAIFYYFLPLAATVSILLFIVFAFSENSPFSQSRQQFVYGAILSANLFIHLVQYTINLSPNYRSQSIPSAEIQYLKKQQLKDYDLYVFNNANYVTLYNQYRILSPSKWIYHFFWNWFEKWDADNSILASITQDLKKHRTQYVLDYTEVSYFPNQQHVLYWKSFLKANYDQIPLENITTKGILWKIKQAP